MDKKSSPRGRPRGSGKFAEQTVAVRVPVSALPSVEQMLAPLRRRRTIAGTCTGTETRLGPGIGKLIHTESRIVLPPTDAEAALRAFREAGLEASAAILDPWYTLRPGRANPDSSLSTYLRLIALAGEVSQHVFVWGRAEALAPLLERLPGGLRLREWLVWAFPNCPSRSRSWRPAHQTCLHLSRHGAPIYPEAFLSTEQRALLARSKLRFFPGPANVLRSAMISGWALRGQDFGHPAAKPVQVITPLLQMTCRPGDWVVDVTAGSGTTAIAAEALGLRWLVSDRRAEYVRMIEGRLGTRRIRI